MALKKEEIFRKKPSKEESTYHAAISLMDAVDCVERFERKVDALRDAAALFESLGDYQDAKQYGEDCLERADEVEAEGCRKTYALGMKKKKKALTKSDYVDAIEEFRRLREYEPYQNKIRQEIEECKRQIGRLETLRAYKRRAIALLALVLICLGLSQTPVFPLAKGVVHYFKGEHQAALNCYQAAEHLPGVNKLKRAAYYKLAEETEQKGKDKKAMQYYRQAWYYSDAPEKTVDLEKKLIAQAEIGDTVFFGPRRWTLLSREGEEVLLLSRSSIAERVFDTDGKSWEESAVKEWLAASVQAGSYLKQERAMMAPVDQKSGDVQETLFLLSKEEYLNYQSLIPLDGDAWWLRSRVIESRHAMCVSGGQTAALSENQKVDKDREETEPYIGQILTIPGNLKRGVRPAVWISLK